MQDWQRRSQLELEVIIREVLLRRDAASRTESDYNDLLRLLKDGIELDRLPATNPHPEDGTPWKRSRVTCPDLREFALAIDHEGLLKFCEVWDEGRESWAAKEPPDLKAAENARSTSTVKAPFAAAPLKQDFDKAYCARITDGRYPTVREDEAWRRTMGIDRQRMRDLRAKHRPHSIKKGGAPKQNLAAEPGGK